MVNKGFSNIVHTKKENIQKYVSLSLKLCYNTQECYSSEDD